jgi:hypothetical protein
MRRYSTSRRDENDRTFEDPLRAIHENEERLAVLPWQNKKALARTKKALPVVP